MWKNKQIKEYQILKILPRLFVRVRMVKNNARLFIRVRTNSQAIRTDPYSDSEWLFVRVRLHNRGYHYSMSKTNPNPYQPNPNS